MGTTSDTISTFTPEEFELVVDAVAMLFVRRPERRSEIMSFASQHPELQLFHPEDEPIAEEDR